MRRYPASAERVIVVGAGLVGCALAIVLVRRGLRVTVYERNPDCREEQSSRRPSLNLSLCTRGLRSLDRIGVLPRLQPMLAPAFGRMIHTPAGTLSYQPYSAFDQPIHCVSRRALGIALLDAAEQQGVEILFGRTCVGVDPETGTMAIAPAAGGVCHDGARAIFAADGGFSRVRHHLSSTGRCAASQVMSDEGYKEFRVSPAQAVAAGLGTGRLHGWPRPHLIAGAFPEPDGSFAGTMHMAVTGPVSFESMSGAALGAMVRRECPDLADAVPDLVDQLALQRPNTMMTVRCRPWSAAGTVLLVGDAAHAMLPYYGQGANAGFEDCAILDDLIDRHGTNWSRVFEEFERARRTDTDAMADLCHEHLTVLRDDVSRPQFQSQWRIEQVLHRLMPDLFTPLYAMIAFSSLSYAEARRRDRLQQQVVRELLHDDSVSRAAVSPAAAAALRHRVRARLGTASAPAARLPFVGA